MFWSCKGIGNLGKHRIFTSNTGSYTCCGILSWGTWCWDEAISPGPIHCMWDRSLDGTGVVYLQQFDLYHLHIEVVSDIFTEQIIYF